MIEISIIISLKYRNLSIIRGAKYKFLVGEWLSEYICDMQFMLV